MRDLKRSKKKMYNKQMSTVANSCKDESIMEMEQFERGCKNKNNNNGCNSNNNNSNNNGCCNPQEPQFASPSQNNNQNHHQKHEHESY